MGNNSIARSVKNLQELYTVVVGLSLATGIQQIVNFSETSFPVVTERLPLFFVFLSFVIPVYHGAMRHLDIGHIENRGKRYALIADFFILFIEGCFFLLLAGLVSQTFKFFYVLLTLLVIDFVWAFIAYFGFCNKKIDQKASGTWGLLNFGTFALLVLVYLYCDSLANAKLAEHYLRLSTLVLMVVRMIIDYKTCYSFYYPDEETKE